jgi:hypothetical protein
MDRNNDVLGALAAYREAVSRLRNVMERVGVEPNSDGKKRKGKAEEEGRTLRGIVSGLVLRFWIQPIPGFQSDPFLGQCTVLT